MPRKHKHVPGTAYRRNYSMDNLERALEAVIADGMSFKQAAEAYQVPKTTIYRKYRGQNGDTLGRPPALNVVEENQIVNGMITAAEFGYPFTISELKRFVKHYLDRKGVRSVLKNNLPGIEWCNLFLGRHDELRQRNSDNIKRVRAELGPEVICSYFDHLETTLENVEADNIINYDETNLTDDPGKIRVIVRRGVKHAHRTIDFSKSSTSVMFAATGSGLFLPPYIVYKAKNLYPEWLQGGPDGCYYNRSETGWFDAPIFEDWFEKVALVYFRRLNGKKVIIGDNLGSHLSLKVLQLCKTHNIHFVFLPPNSTHLLQPLDVAVFRSIKAAWRKILNEWKLQNRGCLPKTEFPRLLRKTIESINNGANVLAGFRACGIIPVNREIVTKKLIPRGVETVATGALNDSFSDIMGNLVRENRTEKKKRSKKIDIPAGKGICPEDLPEETVPEVASKKRKRPSKTVSSSGCNSEANIENEEEFDQELVNADPIPSCSRPQQDVEIADTTIVDTAARVLSLPQLTVDDFVTVKFIYNQNSKNETVKTFVAQIKKITKSKITVSCMRSYRAASDIFIFPNVPDICETKLEQIELKLLPPIIKRGLHTFACLT